MQCNIRNYLKQQTKIMIRLEENEELIESIRNSNNKEAVALVEEFTNKKLCRFFKFFRDNGEKFIGLSIEQFVEQFIKHDKK